MFMQIVLHLYTKSLHKEAQYSFVGKIILAQLVNTLHIHIVLS